MAASTKRKILIALGIVVLLGAVVGAAFVIDDQLQFKISGKYEAYDLVGQLAPEFVAIDAVSGREVTLQEMRGKPTVLVFFATGCGVCRVQMPELEKFQETDAGKKANLFIVSGLEHSRIPVVGRQRFVITYLQKHDWMSLPALIAPSEMQKAFLLQATPTLYVLDREGRITYAGLSDHSAGRLESLVEATL